MIGRRTPVPIDELRAVLRHVRAIDVRPQRRATRRQIAAYAAFAVILAGSLRAAAPDAYLSSSPQPIEESRMRTLQNLGVVSSIAIIASVATAQDAVQWRVEDGGNGHWYEALVLAEPGLNWVDSRMQAQARGGDLASLESTGEWAFATALVDLSRFSAWIGLYQLPGACEPGCEWMWVSGAPLGQANWAPGEPNNIGGPYGDEDHALIAGFGWNGSGYSSRWVDWPGATTLKTRVALIEWSSDCNNDGIVDYGQIRAGELVDLDDDNIPDCCELGFDCRLTAVQWRLEDGGNGHWYSLAVSGLPFTAARAHAESVGGHLVTITSAAEQSFISASVADQVDFLNAWMGLYQDSSSVEPAGGWRWVTGEALQGYSNWWNGVPQPDNDACGLGVPEDFAMWAKQWGGAWADVTADQVVQAPCTGPQTHAILEWSADCNNDGIVDYGQIRAGELADANANNIPDCCETALGCNPCRADIDQSGAVNGVDLAAILNNWGTSGGKQPRSDVNADGIVDGADLAEVLNSWGTCP